MNILLSLLAMSGLLSLFSPNTETLVQVEEVQAWYQPQQATKVLDAEIQFWQSKHEDAPNQLTYHLQLANAYEQRFSTYGRIEDLRSAEGLLATGLEQASVQKVQFLRALARNYISQHRFQEALSLAEAAMEQNDSRLRSTYLLFDVYMEVGRYEEAEQLLHKMAQEPNFQYLIRKAKWEDHRGNLTFAIARLEEAKAILDPEKQTGQAIWLYANLGDFYGHAGEIEKAYQHYRMTLALDPANWYAYKGLAWIAYAHDQQPEKARSMVYDLMRNNDSPDLHLFLAELYEYEGDEACAAAEKETFQWTSQQAAYGQMYRIPRLELLLAEGRAAAAFTQAGEEVKERPTPETYGYFALALFQQGMTTTAQQIAREHVFRKTVEPVALQQLRVIFPEQADMQQYIRDELAGTAFEIGPLAYAALQD